MYETDGRLCLTLPHGGSYGKAIACLSWTSYKVKYVEEEILLEDETLLKVL